MNIFHFTVRWNVSQNIPPHFLRKFFNLAKSSLNGEYEIKACCHHCIKNWSLQVKFISLPGSHDTDINCVEA